MTATRPPGVDAPPDATGPGSLPPPEPPVRRRAMVVAVLLAVATAALVVAVMVHRSKAGEPGLPNPAAVFCEQRGGTTYGPEPMCRLPDGTTVDAWELFRQQSTTSP